MDQAILDKDITQLLGIDSLEPDAQAAFIEDIGSLILDAALLRLVADLSEEQEEQLNDFLDKDPEPGRLLQHLLSHFSNFETILEEEVAAFKEEVIAVMPPMPETEGEEPREQAVEQSAD